MQDVELFPAFAGEVKPMNSRRGVTLLELLIAITLVSLLSTGMLFAIRTGLGALEGVQRRVNDNRRVTGAYRILEQQLGSFLPVRARCGQATGAPGNPTMFFQGEPSVLRFVSAYSLEGAHRGHPVIVEIFVGPGDQGRGVRLLVNETPYFGPAGRRILLHAPDARPQHRHRAHHVPARADAPPRYLRPCRPPLRRPLLL
jgi:prepilin-type N-terminal cleavage/methylation domain-containing protein